MRHLASRGVLAVLTAFLALTTILGATLVVPTLPREWLEGSVFGDYTIPALALAFVGGLSLVAFGAAVRRPEVAGGVAVAAGLSMVAFEAVEIWVVGFSLVEYGADEPFAWLQIVYIAAGLLTAAVGLWLWQGTADDRARLTRTTAHAAT
jgi:hypothetical protein